MGFIFMPLLDSNKMEFHKIQFNCKVYGNIENGFKALEGNIYLIRFQDNKYRHFFNKDDKVVITIENVEQESKESIREGHSVVYCILKSFESNGFKFIDCSEKDDETFFWNYRGMLTYRTFEKKDVFERDSILRIDIKRI